jgi:histidine triad (HIT) family protein
MPECLFCDMASGKMDVPKLHDDDMVFSVRDINPRAPVHFMVIPKEHLATVVDISESHGPLLARMVSVANRIAKDEGLTDRGYRLVINCGREGGQAVYHLHMHVLGGRRLGAEG